LIVFCLAGDAFWPFSEHDWDGVSSADCVFPMFLFIVGVSTVLAFRRKKLQEFEVTRLCGFPFVLLIKSFVEVWTAVAKRTFLLILIGVIINWSAGKFSFVHLHFPGILQRIGVCYIAVVLLYCLPPRWLARCIVLFTLFFPPICFPFASTKATSVEDDGEGCVLR